MFKARHWLRVLLALILLLAPLTTTLAYAADTSHTPGVVKVCFADDGSAQRYKSVTINGKSGLSASASRGEQVVIEVTPKAGCKASYIIELSSSVSPIYTEDHDDGSLTVSFTQSSAGAVIEVTLIDIYTMTLDANGAQKNESWPDSNTMTVERGEEFWGLWYLNSEYYVTAPEGYRFAGFEIKDSKGTATITMAQLKDSEFSYIPPSNATIKYLWEKIPVVSFNAGEGSGTMAPAVANADGSYTLPACSFEAPQCKAFKSWNLGAAGETVSISADTTLIAQWEDSHNLIKTEKVDATCENTGTEAYWTCTDCDKMFSDEAGTQLITEPAVIDAIDHNWSFIGFTYDTDADNNLTSAEACFQCTNDETHLQNVKASFERVEEINPTCTEQGKITWKVSVTAEESLDNEDHEEAQFYTRDIDALGHDWGPWKVTVKPTTTKKGEKQRICKRDASHVQTRSLARVGKITYRVTKGDGATWAYSSSDGLSFTIKRNKNDKSAFSHFTGILVDGKAVDAANYTAKSGSVIVELKPSYLNTLSIGKHTLAAQFDDGKDALASFTIQAKASENKTANTTTSSDRALPQTGDSAHLGLLITLMVGSLAGIMGLLATRKGDVRG